MYNVVLFEESKFSVVTTKPILFWVVASEMLSSGVDLAESVNVKVERTELTSDGEVVEIGASKYQAKLLIPYRILNQTYAAIIS